MVTFGYCPKAGLYRGYRGLYRDSGKENGIYFSVKGLGLAFG